MITLLTAVLLSTASVQAQPIHRVDPTENITPISKDEITTRVDFCMKALSGSMSDNDAAAELKQMDVTTNREVRDLVIGCGMYLQGLQDAADVKSN